MDISEELPNCDPLRQQDVTQSSRLPAATTTTPGTAVYGTFFMGVSFGLWTYLLWPGSHQHAGIGQRKPPANHATFHFYLSSTVPFSGCHPKRPQRHPCPRPWFAIPFRFAKAAIRRIMDWGHQAPFY
eukprot:scaffold31766_cov146-Skeletonema_marinoi.AAC.1